MSNATNLHQLLLEWCKERIQYYESKRYSHNDDYRDNLDELSKLREYLQSPKVKEAFVKWAENIFKEGITVGLKGALHTVKTHEVDENILHEELEELEEFLTEIRKELGL